MKKILYIIPVLVLAMVVLAQDAKAQSNGSTVSGQTGNASNAITQGATNAVTAAALLTTTTGSDNSTTNGGSTVTNGVSVQAQTPSVQTTIKLSFDIRQVGNGSIQFNTKQEIVKAVSVPPSRIRINSISAG